MATRLALSFTLPGFIRFQNSFVVGETKELPLLNLTRILKCHALLAQPARKKLQSEKKMRNIRSMDPLVFGFPHIDKTKFSIAGGKGANLGELTRIEGIRVPEGFCISTGAFKKIIGQAASIEAVIDQLSQLRADDRDKIIELSAEIRRLIEQVTIPENIKKEISHFLSGFGKKNAYAIRSSATAEDLPMASFAGQQDSYLNILGEKAILKHISKCWASLFTERAIIYRLQNGFDHRKVQLAVVVQKMILPEVAGILFTADPLTCNRKLSSIDASFGLGEALVSGRTNADIYKVSNGKIIDKKISAKKLAIYASKNGGTNQQQVEPENQNNQALTDEQILELEVIGKKIEGHFGCPQDVEWCLADGFFYIVQSRPITTLFPIPRPTAPGSVQENEQEGRVYVSVGHQQMMTDAMRPLGISFFQLTAARPMYEAGGRLFVDVTHELASPVRREILVNVLGKSDPLIRDALLTILAREDFIKSLPDDKQEQGRHMSSKSGRAPNFQTLNDYDPVIVSDLIKTSQTSINELKDEIQTRSGPDLFDFILEDIQRLRKSLSDPQSFGVIMTAMNASSWINEKMDEWLGEKNVADTLSQSAPNNITSEMGLELLDLADVIRPYPDVIKYLQHAKGDNFLDGLAGLQGGRETRDAIYAYLKKYGIRCVGEIDLTKTRWAEKPTTLVPIILQNIKNFGPGAGNNKFEQGRRDALNKEQELLTSLKQLPDGEQKAKQAKQMIDRVRNFIGYREYPKYSIVNRYFIYKQALIKEAERLARNQTIREKEDIYYLRFEELHQAVRSNHVDDQLITKRKQEHELYEKLTPPRVITSEGEIIPGQYKRENIPAKAMVGLPVSSGVVEGRARVVLNMEDADLENGDILITSFTDPSWTPLFIAIKGLVTEVGGLMTHGAVIAREYGLPAVVGVENATKLIRDGQRIRIDGAQGYVQIL